MKSFLKYLPALALVLVFSAFDLPKGWIKAGSDPAKYELNVEKGAGQEGKNAAYIKSIAEVKPNSNALLMQTFQAEKYIGKRIRMSAYLKTKDVTGWAGLIMRIDQSVPPGPGQSPAMDSMQDRPVKGTTDWTKYEIVLDVDKNATNITFGASLNGAGQVWLDNFSFEVVDTSVPLTGAAKKQGKSQAENLGFEE